MESSTANTKLILQDITPDELFGFINDFPALLWRIEIKKARIEFLNDNIMISPGVDGAQLLKNTTYRNNIILPEGTRQFDKFMDSAKEGKDAATVFRVKNQNGKLTWLKLTGAINRNDPRYYYGYLLNVDDTVSVIKGILGMDLDLELMIEDSENAVFIFNYETLDILCANTAAMNLFGISETDFGTLPLSKLSHDLMNQPLDSVYKELPVARSWRGSLSLHSMDQKKQIQAESVLRYMVHNDQQLVRVSLQGIKAIEQDRLPVQDFNSEEIEVLKGKLEPLDDIAEIMEACITSHLISEHYDAILFSDIYIRKNMVMVYWGGEPFINLSQAESFSYKGTIAEDINRYSLEYLIVDDTQDSIKPIDWALFVPHGIRSYFAYPFYSRSVLRTVLILCSTKTACFTGKKPTDFQVLFETINTAIRSWRRQQR